MGQMGDISAFAYAKDREGALISPIDFAKYKGTPMRVACVYEGESNLFLLLHMQKTERELS